MFQAFMGTSSRKSENPGFKAENKKGEKEDVKIKVEMNEKKSKLTNSLPDII